MMRSMQTRAQGSEGGSTFVNASIILGINQFEGGLTYVLETALTPLMLVL